MKRGLPNQTGRASTPGQLISHTETPVTMARLLPGCSTFYKALQPKASLARSMNEVFAPFAVGLASPQEFAGARTLLIARNCASSTRRGASCNLPRCPEQPDT